VGRRKPSIGIQKQGRDTGGGGKFHKREERGQKKSRTELASGRVCQKKNWSADDEGRDVISGRVLLSSGLAERVRAKEN